VSPAGLWTRVAAGAAVGVTFWLAVTPERPPLRMSWLPALGVGLVAGLVLFGAVARAAPRLPTAGGSAAVVAGRLAFLCLWAAVEEVVWRRVALGELLHAGALPALAGSTIGFALVHPSRRLLHLGTGGMFGAVYLATGALVACVAAHSTYNALVAGMRRASPGAEGAT
jgi:hypothetical protein